MLSEELDPVDAHEVARVCFAANSPKVTSDKVKAGLFPECDYSIPKGRWPKALWFRATVDAWRRKHFALQVVTRPILRELQEQGGKDAELAINELHRENMRKAAEHAAQIGERLLNEQRDADHELADA